MSMNAFNGKCHLQGLPALELLNRFSKHFAQLISSVTPPHMQVFGSVGPKGACLRMREIVIVRRLFLGFYRAMHFSAKRGIAIACRLSVSPSVRPSL